MDSLSEGMRYELQQHGIDVACWRPAGVKTAKFDKNHDAPTFITADDMAESALNKAMSGVHHGGLRHEIMGLVIDQVSDVLPWFGDFMASNIANMLKGIKAKEEAQKKK
jgi:short-subunit dehydrogenase